MSTGVGDIFLDLKLNKQPFEKGLNETKATATMAGKRIGMAIAGAIAGAVATVGFGHLISSTAKLGDAIDKTSQKMGMSAQTYQEWDFIMQRCGTSMESMTMAMKTLASSAVTSKDALSELGISQEEVASLSQEQLFARTIQALQNVEDTTRRTYLAGQLLGRGATELGAVLNMSASETDALRQRVWELGGVMSQEAVTSSAQYQDALLDLRMAFRGVSDTVAVTVLPLITSAINKVIIPIILRAVAVIRYFGSILASAFGGFGKKLKSTFGGGAQKQTIKFSDGIGSVGKRLGSAGKTAKKTKKAVKELNREMMGFDKMNKLAKKDKGTDAGDTGGGGGGAGGGGISGAGFEPMGMDDTPKKLGLFGKLAEKLRPIWKALGDVLRAVIRLFKAVGKALAPVGKWLWEHLIKPFGKLLGMAIVAVLEGIAGAIDMVASFIEKHPKISVVLMGIGTALLMILKRGAVIGFFKKFGKVFGTFGKFLAGNWIAILLIAIALAIGYIYKNWDKIKKTKFGKALIKVGKVLKTVASIVKTKAQKAFEKIKPILMFIAKTVIKNLVFRFKVMIATIKQAIGTFKKIASYLKGAFKKALNVVLKPLRKISSIWKSIKTKKSTLTTKLAGAKVKTFETLSKAWKGVKDKTAEMKAKIASKWSDLKKKWKNITKNIKNKTADMKAKIASKWSDFKDKWNRLLDNFKGKTAKIKLAFVDKLKKGYNTIAEKIQATRKRWPATKIILPDLHPLAQGGWLEKNTPRLAIVGDNRHEGEIVAPESKLEAMARKVAQESGGSDAQVVALLGQILRAVASVNTNVYLDGREIANNTVRQINQQTRTTGVSPLLV